MAVLGCLVALWASVASAGLADSARTRLREAELAEAQQPAGVLAGDVRNARVWAISDVGDNIAQIRALAAVERAAQDAGLLDATVNVESTAEKETGARIVIVLDGVYDQTTFGELLAQLGKAEESLTPSEIEVDRDRRRLRLRIIALHISPKSAP